MMKKLLLGGVLSATMMGQLVSAEPVPLTPEQQDEMRAELTQKATAEVRRQRKELF